MTKWDYGRASGTSDASSSRRSSRYGAGKAKPKNTDWLYHDSDEDTYQETPQETGRTNDDFLNTCETYPRCYSKRESGSSNLHATSAALNSDRNIASARMSNFSNSTSRRSANTMYLYFPSRMSGASSRVSSIIRSARKNKRCFGKSKNVRKRSAAERKLRNKRIAYSIAFILFIALLGLAIYAGLYFSERSRRVVDAKFRPIPGLFDPRSILGKNKMKSIQLMSLEAVKKVTQAMIVY